MPRNGAMTLDDFPADHRFKITCAKCDRRGEYSAARLRDRFGDAGLPDILAQVSADCPRRHAAGIDRCAAVYQLDGL